MSPANDLVQALTDPHGSTAGKREAAERFSRHFGWRPNDLLEVPNALPAANLVVEQGLDNAAMLSFLPSHRRLDDIRADEALGILELSYNSLVDWHIWIDQDSIQYFYNRSDPPAPMRTTTFSEADDSALTRRVFDEAVGEAPNPNLLSLDGALLDTISTWRKILRVELGTSATSASISALFNAIILARAVEDFYSRTRKDAPESYLRDIIADHRGSIADAIAQALGNPLGPGGRISRDLFDRTALAPFERLSEDSRIALVEAFYRHDAVPYSYDFSVMSRHALSKIYERYVAVMQHEESIQFSLFPSAHEESWNKQLGGIYTPQYIASFFARYLRQLLPAGQFLEASVADPACGSGVFLRAVMEQKLLGSRRNPAEDAGVALESLLGIDVDENAVAASRLSLALLYLAARGELPTDVPVELDDSIERFGPESTQRDRDFDAVMANPPFVRTESQPEDVRRAIANHVGFAAKGKLDTYLAFLVFSIKALRPGGYGFFVVPQPLLTSDNLRSLRQWIRDEAWVHVIADLSAIRVFRADVYIALLVVQRKGPSGENEPPVALIRCQRDVGLALEDFLDRNHRRTSSYFIFEASQDVLSRPTWSVATPEESSLLERLEAMPRLNDVAVVRQGAITGADDIFVIDTEEVPPGEDSLYRPLLPDRMIGRFLLPEETGKRVFYPYIDGEAVTESQLEAEFPVTWSRLSRNRATLSSRKSVATDSTDWWRPTRPRPPHEMLAPKVVVPEVSLVPRFGLDTDGRWVVSHSPFVRARTEPMDEDLLLVLAAVLNSSASAWFLDMNSRKYRDGYNKIGVALLRRLPIPDLSRVPQIHVRSVIASVREVLGSSEDVDLGAEAALDDLVLRELYDLSDEEIALLKPQTPLE